MRYDLVDIKLIQHGVRILETHVSETKKNKKFKTYLAKTRREYHNLIELTHLLQKVVDTRPFDDIHIVPLPFNLDRNHVIGLGDKLQHRVSK